MRNALRVTLILLVPVLGCQGQVIGPAEGLAPTIGGTGGAQIPGGNPPGSGGVGDGSGGAAPTGSGGRPVPTDDGGGVGSSGGAGSATGSGGQGTGGNSFGTGGRAGAPADAGAGDSGAVALGIPCEIQTILINRCQTCHGPTPLFPASNSLVTYQNLTATSRLDPTKTEAALAVTRMQSSTIPMPPLPGTPATMAEINAMQAWVAAGYPPGTCGVPPAGGGMDGGASDARVADGGATDAAADAGGTSNPFTGPAVCTSKVMWTGGNRGSSSMNPGRACISCHNGGGPRFTIAGTAYPTAHEPNLCNGVNGNTGARIVITGADGKVLTLTPNGAGNYYSSAVVAKPFRAKITYMGRERLMVTPQTNGDCNSCHTQTGANLAPGRILLP